jgi:2,3-diaminopropionate biosynthesis protein SbnB
MTDGSLLVLDGETVHELLDGREHQVVDVVARAYRAHAAEASALPHSVFLRFPDGAANRIIALPAYLGDEWHTAGMKWISSFPGNVDTGLDRASAVLVLNSADTGHPFAVLEGSQISAQRTAASAALAARHLWTTTADAHVAVVGCGLIAYETIRFLHRTVQPLRSLTVYDLSPRRAQDFAAACERELQGVSVHPAADLAEAVSGASLILFATTASAPHVRDAKCFAPGATVLHLSLRDLSPEVILACDNIVDDPDHVCRADTSVHLAERLHGSRAFIRATLADVVSGDAPARRTASDVVIFSPFGLGILDLAVGHLLVTAAEASSKGIHIPGFLPRPWRGFSEAMS